MFGRLIPSVIVSAETEELGLIAGDERFLMWGINNVSAIDRIAECGDAWN